MRDVIGLVQKNAYLRVVCVRRRARFPCVVTGIIVILNGPFSISMQVCTVPCMLCPYCNFGGGDFPGKSLPKMVWPKMVWIDMVKLKRSGMFNEVAFHSHLDLS